MPAGYKADLSATGRICTACNIYKLFDKFYKDRHNPHGFTTRCQSCMRAYDFARRGTPEGKIVSQRRWKEWRENNPEKYRDQWMRKYGITSAQYDAMYANQNGKCLICETTSPRRTGPRGRNLHIDHCHVHGKIRGLICGHCNAGLGQFRESATLLFKAAHYLTQNCC
jgi:Recombination endonuclease VII